MKKGKTRVVSRDNNGRKTAQEELPSRQERAEHILDVASDLLLRWGYKKTTVDDIARQAGVAKGTIYLHWKSREKLFIDLIIREKVREGRKVVQAMARDPEGTTLHGMIKHSFLVTMHNPLIKALIVRDMDMLGELLHSSAGIESAEVQITAFKTFLEFQQKQKLIRSDLSVSKQVQMLEAILIGFLLIDQYLPEEYHATIEEKAEMVAESVQRTFELRLPDQDEQHSIARQFELILDTAQAYVQKEYKP